MQLNEDGARTKRLQVDGSRSWIVAIIIAILAVAALVAGGRLGTSQIDDFHVVQKEAASGSGAVDRDHEPVSEVVVDVSGAVHRPGLYRLDEGERIGDAIEAAGGITPEAVLDSINRAAKLVDGQKIHVPSSAETTASLANEGGVPGGSTQETGALISINSADAEQLDAIKGVGPSTAAAIVEDREANGPFETLEDLMRVSGIGEKKFEALKGQICL